MFNRRHFQDVKHGIRKGMRPRKTEIFSKLAHNYTAAVVNISQRIKRICAHP